MEVGSVPLFGQCRLLRAGARRLSPGARRGVRGRTGAGAGRVRTSARRRLRARVADAAAGRLVRRSGRAGRRRGHARRSGPAGHRGGRPELPLGAPARGGAARRARPVPAGHLRAVVPLARPGAGRRRGARHAGARRRLRPRARDDAPGRRKLGTARGDRGAGAVVPRAGAAGRAGHLPDGTAAGEPEIYRAAGFRGPRRFEVPGRDVTRTTDDVVAGVFSLSSAAPHLFGDRRAEFEAELRAVLHRASPAGTFTERLGEIAVDLWQP